MRANSTPWKSVWQATWAALCISPIAVAQDAITTSGAELPESAQVRNTGRPSREVFPDGHEPLDLRLQVLAGFSASTSLGPDADFDYNHVNLRAEIVLFPDHSTGILPKGDFNCLADFMIADPQDFGSIIVGPSVLLRKELRPSTARMIPYVQAGGGMVYTDADNVASQRVIGRSWEFLLQTGLGCHWRLNDLWMLDVEGSYQHISNARLAARNLGSNNLGVMVGLTREWGPLRRR